MKMSELQYMEIRENENRKRNASNVRKKRKRRQRKRRILFGIGIVSLIVVIFGASRLFVKISNISDTATQTVSGNTTLTKKELEAEIPLLLQSDKRWGSIAYGDSDIAQAGCAPTCLSMVIIGLTKNEKATPDAVAMYSEQKGYYVEGTGTMWTLMTEGCQKYDIIGEEISLSKNAIWEALEAKHPIICSMRPGDFTTEGHFIVLTGIKDGKITLNDPNSRSNSKKTWSYEQLEPQIKNLWAFQKL
jgi:hypothetical protein